MSRKKADPPDFLTLVMVAIWIVTGVAWIGDTLRDDIIEEIQTHECKAS